MFKKLVVAALAVAAGLFILNSTHLGGYARTFCDKIRRAVKKQIPIEVQLEALRHEARQLVPDMKEQVNALAAKEVAVDRLRNQVTDIQASLTSKRAELQTMKDDLKSGARFITYHDVSYPREAVHNKLVRDLAAYTRCAAELESKKKLLQAEEETVSQAKEQLASMRSAKEQVEIEIAQLEAELKSVQLAETRSTFALDDSRLSAIKARLADIHDQLKQRRLADTYWGAFQSNGEIKVEKRKSDAEVIKEAEAVLGEHDPQLAGK